MLDSLVSGIFNGDAKSISRAITIVENDGDSDIVRNLIREIFPRTGNAHIVGITGPPGIGKSTMIGRICSLLSEQGKKVSVVAIDASSPFTGGSLLGNRIRMQEALWQDDIYMRSLANRGAKGGLSDSALGAVSILDAAGSDIILLETVGAGQADLDIMNLADTTILVLGPGLGDQIQAIKAGIMEIADIFVINKMDLEGSYFAMKDIEEILTIDEKRDFSRSVVGTTKSQMESYVPLKDAILKHGEFLRERKMLGFHRKKFGLKWVLESELSARFVTPILKGLEQSDPNLINENIYEKVEKILDKLTL